MMYSLPCPISLLSTDGAAMIFSWIELKNTGEGVLDTQGIQFTSGIEYTLPQVYPIQVKCWFL
jgi:hypothetical protein